MPTYDYECTKCERRFEEFQSISAKPFRHIKTECDQCNNKAPVRRLIGTGAALLFKGSGFYETDYRSDSYKKAAKAEKEGTKKPDADGKKSGDGDKAKSAESSAKKTESTKSGDSKGKS